MELVVDLERVTVVLANPADVTDLQVRVGAPDRASASAEADVHRLHDVLAAAYVGRLDAPRQAVVRADAIRFHAAGQVDDRWEERFSGLCGARAAVVEGAEGLSLRAPVRWPGDSPVQAAGHP